MHHPSIHFVAGLSLLFAAGCASKSTSTADIMRGHANDSQAQVDLKNQLAKDWDRGTKMVLTGEQRIARGEKNARKAEQAIVDARKEIARGNREVTDGRQLVQVSEKRFRAAFPSLELEQLQ